MHAGDNAPLSRRRLIRDAGTTYWTENGSASNSAWWRGGWTPFALPFMASSREQRAAMAWRLLAGTCVSRCVRGGLTAKERLLVIAGPARQSKVKASAEEGKEAKESNTAATAETETI